MLTKSIVRFILVLWVILLLPIVVVGSTVKAKENPLSDAIPAINPNKISQQAGPIPGGPGHISIMGGTFTPTDDTMRWNVNAGELSNPDSVNDGSYIASVMLPQGATVKQLVVYYNDLRDDNLIVELRRKTIDEYFQNLASVSSEGNGGYGFSANGTINENFKTIDNESYAYALTAFIPKKVGATYNNLYLVRVRIDYDYPVYLPTVQK